MTKSENHQVLVKSERRVPMPAASVAVRCGEREVAIEVKQNFLGNDCHLRLRIDPQRFMFLSAVSTSKGQFSCCDVWKKKHQVRPEAGIGKLNGRVKMGESVAITANGTGWTINIMFSLDFFAPRKEHPFRA